MAKTTKKAKTPKGKGGGTNAKGKATDTQNDPIVGTWGPPAQGEEAFAWTTTNGNVTDGLIKGLPENSSLIWEKTKNAKDAEIKRVLSEIPTYELYRDNNRDFTVDSGDSLIAKGYSTIDGMLYGGDSGIFRGKGSQISVIDNAGLVVGQLTLAENVF
jgi:hypothetical protein